MNPVTAVVVGAGDRGRHVYGTYALEHPGELRIIAVAEPDVVRRREFSELHGIPPERSFAGYEELFAAPRLADAALICTQDGMHYRPALLAKQAGYHVLLEKPISNTPEECVRIWKDCAQNTAEGQIFAVCHVLRYTPFFLQIKKLLDEGAVGRLVNLQYEEDIGFYHFAHSYVRGNWRDESCSSPLVLAKSCHDLDILRWLAGSPVQHISSTGSLVEFTPANRPAGAPDRCAEGCPTAQTCPYNAVRLYHGFLPGAFLRPIVELEDATHDLDHALLYTGYGRCVYACGNNVPDHQAVSLHFENGVDAQLTITAFSSRITRIVHLMGTRGEIQGDLAKNLITLTDFASMKKTRIRLDVPAEGHHGGDRGLTGSFVAGVAGGSALPTALSQSLESHLMAFAAEKARREHTVVDFKEFIRPFGL